MGWLRAKSLASETGQIVLAGGTSNISLTSTITTFTKMKGSTTYPAGGTDIGIVTSTGLTTVSLYECGIIFVYSTAAGGYDPSTLLSPGPIEFTESSGMVGRVYQCPA